MSGERTPDTTPLSKAGSSDDEISLREHLQRQIDLQRDNGIRMFNEFREHYDALLAERKEEYEIRDNLTTALLAERHEALKTLLDERYARTMKETDDAFNLHQRQTEAAFTAAQEATRAALASTEAAIAKVERALEDRFAAQARALDKAEVATDKRFDAVNEFRGQLADLIRGFMPRTEAEVRTQNLADRVDNNSKSLLTTSQIQADRITKLELDVRTALATNQGKSTGRSELVAWVFAAAGFVSGVVGIALALSRKT